MRDVVFSEAEYSILVTRIETYATFLANSISKYTDILDFLAEDAIHDELIQSKILKLKSDVSLYTQQLEAIQAETKTLVSNLSDEFEKADSMKLPSIDTAGVQTLLNLFR